MKSVVILFAFFVGWLSVGAQSQPQIFNNSGATQFCQDAYYKFGVNLPSGCAFTNWSFSNGQLAYEGSSNQNTQFASIKFPAAGNLIANCSCGTASYPIYFFSVPASVTITPSKTIVNLLETFTLTGSGANFYSWSGDGMLSTSGNPVSATPDNGGSQTYTVYGSTVAGTSCVASSSTTITVTKLIDVGPDKNYCRADGDIDLNRWGQSLATGSWSGPAISNGGILIRQLGDGNYRYVYTRNSDNAKDVLYLAVSGPMVGTAAIVPTSLCGQLTGDLNLTTSIGSLNWQRSYDSGTTWSTITGATNRTYHYSETQDTWFRIVAQSGSCPIQLSNIVKAETVNAQPGTITQIPDPNSCQHATGTLQLSNYVGAVQFWQRSTDNGNTYLTIPNSNSAIIPYDETATTFFKAAVQQGTCNVVYTAPIQVDPVITVGGTLVATSTTLDCGNSQATLQLQNFQGDVFTWQTSFDGNSWTDNGELTGTQNSVTAHTDTWYRIKVDRSGVSCPSAYSYVFKLQTSTQPGTVSTTNTAQCGTASGNLILSDYIGEIVRWEHSTDNLSWEPITNSAGLSLLPYTTSQPVTYYRTLVQFGNCSAQYSTIVRINVSAPTVAGIVRFDGEVQDAQMVNGALTFYPRFTLVAGSYHGNIQNWWQYIYPDVNGQIINSMASSITPAVTSTTQFRAQVKNGNCDAMQSGSAQMLINKLYLGEVVVVQRTTLNDYLGYSYKVATADGISLRDGFSFQGNSGQSFSIRYDDSYSLPPTDKTYVLEQSILKAGVTDPDDIYFLNSFDRANSYTYFDGLGRTAQQVQRKASPNENDIVVPFTYDDIGRPDKSYLPYEEQNQTGHFVKDAVNAQSRFYLTPTPKVAASDYPFAVKVYEASPLNRVAEQGAPGLDWQPVLGHTVKYQYRTNAANEIILWKINEATSFPENIGHYTAGELYVNTTIDEHGSAVKQFKDKDGNVVEKQVENGNEWLETIYVYDDANQLRFVIQPEGVANLNGNPTEDFLNKWAFQYRYDGVRRMTQKRVPGADWVYMVYDNRDRLVLTQDGNQRTKKEWLFTKYDAFNRPIVAGIYTHTDEVSQAEMRNNISTSLFIESYDSANEFFGYTNTVFPTERLTVLTVTYYDNYTFIGNQVSADFNFDGTALAGMANKFDRVSGLVTGTQIRILNTDTFLKNVSYYDNKYRVIQTVGSNHLGGFDRSSAVYDFPGRVLMKSQKHTKPGQADITIAEEFTYDHAGRVLAQYHKINDGPKVKLNAQGYNALGQLVEKNLHEKSEGGFMQSVDYRYNIRGWLTHINNAALTDDGGVTNDDGNDWFGFELKYNNTALSGTQSQFNGNISEALWKNSGSHEQAYSYSYDPLNRLMNAQYKDLTLPTNNNKFNEQILAYDRNGNIKGLKRTNSLSGYMDNLSYSKYNGNQLLTVDDAGDQSQGFKNGTNTGDDYAYDVNGNLTSDQNKGITSISYNHLNLTENVTKSVSENISFIYDANGTKLSQYSNDKGKEKLTDYSGGFVYENDTLKFILNNEGRVTLQDNNPVYEYFIKDHLGNTRLTFTTKTTTQQYTAGFETENQTGEANNFQNYQTSHINIVSANATSGSNSYKLDGSLSGQVGVARSLSVMPGDVVSIQAYAKYSAPSNTASNLAGFAAALLNAFNLPTPMPGESGTASAALNNWAGSEPAATGDDHGDPDPKVFVTIVIFDRNYNFLDVAYQRLTSSGVMNATYSVKRPGYTYLYVSNEQPYLTDVYFDDVSVTFIPSPIVQMVDYYPFGLSFNSYTRENSVPNKLNLFQNQEHVDDLGLNWDSYRYRNHQPDIGRFFNIDPMAEAFYYNSPYAFSENKVTTHREMEGLEAFFIHGTGQDNSMWKKDMANFIMRELKPYFSTEQTADLGFNWSKDAANSTPMQRVLGGGARNWLNNSENDRASAARQLVSYILKHRKEGQEITLVGHSHGGNVAIQAARILFEKHNTRVNIVNFNTPAFNGVNDPENPWDNFGIDEMLHFFTDGDNVAGPLAGSGKYKDPGNSVNQIRLSNPLNTNFWGTQQHYFENINWQEVLSQFANSQGGNSGGTSGKAKKKIKRAPGPPVVGW